MYQKLKLITEDNKEIIVQVPSHIMSESDHLDPLATQLCSEDTTLGSALTTLGIDLESISAMNPMEEVSEHRISKSNSSKTWTI